MRKFDPKNTKIGSLPVIHKRKAEIFRLIIREALLSFTIIDTETRAVVRTSVWTDDRTGRITLAGFTVWKS
jgi:hypothetical protein